MSLDAARATLDRTAPSVAPSYVPSYTVETCIAAAAAGPAGERRLLILSGPRGEGKTSGVLIAALEVAEAMVREGHQAALPIIGAVVRDTWVNLKRALSLDSLVLTTTGWVKAGDVSVGDTLIAQDGSPTRVLGVYPQGEQPLWRARFSDGSSARVTGDHLWAVQGRWDREYAGPRNRRCSRPDSLPGSGRFRIMRTDHLRERLGSARRRQRAWSIPLVEPVQFPAQPVPIDPYLLGVLLGDGGISSNSVRISTADHDILDRVRCHLLPGLTLTNVKGTNYDYVILGRGRGRTHPIKSGLEELGLWGLKSPDKFIPEIYLWNDQETRLELLRGLMDTDGCVSRDRHVSFSSTSTRLVDGVEFLVRSLGGMTKRRRQQFKAGEGHRHRGHWIYHRHSLWSLAIQMPPGLIPFALPRKARIAECRRRTPWRWVEGIESDGHGQAVCFKVDHPSGLFVMNDFIVTHNTTIVSVEELARKGVPIEWRDGQREAVIAFQGKPWLHLHFFGLERREDYDKLQGFACGLIILEEPAPAAGLSGGLPPEALSIGVTCLRQPGIPRYRIFIPMNPPDEDHWVLKVEETLADLNLGFFRTAHFRIPMGEKDAHFRELAKEAKSEEESAAWGLAAEEFQRYRELNRAVLKATGREDLVARLAEGKVGGVVVGEAVVPMFSEEHLAKEPLPAYRSLPIIRGWDQEPSPACCLFQVLPDGKGLNVLGSHAIENTHMAGFIDAWLLPFMQDHGLMPGFLSAQRGVRQGFTFEDVGDSVLLDSQLTAGRVIMEKLQTTLRPGPVEWEDRRAAALACFERGATGGRRFVLIEQGSNDLLVKGLRGRFRYPREMTTGRVQMTIQAAKRISGLYADVADALFYGLAHKFPAAEWLRKHQQTLAPRVRTPAPKTYLGV